VLQVIRFAVKRSEIFVSDCAQRITAFCSTRPPSNRYSITI
jgi:hypothetical protein